jgi:DNA polymerase I-like protein with 3'-5' exonuclease and polymerase domains
MGGANAFVRTDPIHTLTQVLQYCKQREVTQVITTSTELLKRLLHWTKTKAPSLKNYAGSIFERDGVEFVIISPLAQLVTVPYGKFLATRYTSKFTRPSQWEEPTKFSWELATPANVEEIFESYKSSFFIAVDIETFKTNAVIRCISYTALFQEEGNETITSHTCVLPMDSEFMLAWVRKFNWELKAGKCFANGKYDISYLSRFNAPIYNYLWDVQNLFHSWYSELPKDLAFLNAFFIRSAMYWKDLAETDDLMEYYRYNALDTWATANSFIMMLMQAPDWAIRNYYQEFPLVFPCHLSEMTGIKRDTSRLAGAVAEQEKIIEEKSASLNKILGVENFNVKSSPQMKALFKIIGCGDMKSQDEKHLTKARFRHPFNARIINLVLDIRKARTAIEKYLQTREKAKEFPGTDRILYALNPHGTDSGRLASKEHHFWCGLQIQNITRGPTIKQTFMADEGFYMAEADLEQAESRDTAYISGDKQLIHNVEHSPDFHSANCSAFFGVPFEEIYDVKTSKVLNKALRDIAKRVNHGANYNMGAFVLIETMGEEKVLAAKKLLGLPWTWSLKEVAIHLLEMFHNTYPGIKDPYYAGVQSEILTTKMISSKAILHNEDTPEITAANFEYEYNKQLGSWTRYCFSNPDPYKNKHAYNSYMSHPPQSLNAMVLNKAYLRVFNRVAMNPKYAPHFKLMAQIHDSIFYQYRIGHDYFHPMIKKMMEIPITVRAYDGEVRTFVVPSSVKAGKDGKPALYWSETE